LDPLLFVSCTQIPWGRLFCPQPKTCHALCCHTNPTPSGSTAVGVFGIIGQQCIVYFLHRIFVVRNTQWNVF
jgi:hypothetical protein